jgi:hypothetical protein
MKDVPLRASRHSEEGDVGPTGESGKVIEREGYERFFVPDGHSE